MRTSSARGAFANCPFGANRRPRAGRRRRRGTRNLFINCPFDAQYLHLFGATVFTVLCAGYVPRCTLEVSDSAELRLDRIVRLIRESPLAIHDVSHVDPKMDDASPSEPDTGRAEPKKDVRSPRLNMPFELGIFTGATRFGGQPHAGKRCLIFESHRHSHDVYLSDISGCDPVSHSNEPEKLIQHIRTWLVRGAGASQDIPTANSIYDSYEKFRRAIYRLCHARGDRYADMPYERYPEFTKNVTDWLRINPPG